MTKTTLACSALTCLLALPASAQTTPAGTDAPGSFTPPPSTTRGPIGRALANRAADAKTKDPNVFRTRDVLPEPTPLDEIKAPVVAQPSEPIDEFLLQKDHGPFMVCAYTFTGPEAAKYAQVLAMEIRRDYHLPAYVWLAKIQPMKSNIYGVQPTAPPHARNNDVSPPERWRTQDEAAVFVGNCKTIDESKMVWKQVKGIRPQCLDTFPVIYQNRKGKGLNRAFMTTNPFAASQYLYPGGNVNVAGLPMKQGQAFDPNVATTVFQNARKVDPLVKRMNTGPDARNSITKNPAKYTLKVADFTGRTAVQVTTAKEFDERNPENREALKKSPLITAHDDAERLAEVLNKCKSMSGMRAYVFHTRSASIVTVGGFNAPNDPNFQRIVAENKLRHVSEELVARQFSFLPLRPDSDLMEVPKLD
jgi:hypothetical protein